MSRVIKRAVLHDDPKIIDFPRRSLPVEEVVAEESTTESALIDVGATILEEYQQKAQQLLIDAELEREKILADAQAEAANIIEAGKSQVEVWQQEAHDVGREQGYQDGFATGKTEGLAAAEQEMSETLKGANDKAMQILRLAQEEQRQTLLQSERKMIDIVLAIADKVIPEHFIDAPQAILPLVKVALEKVKDQKALIVRVSEKNYEFVLLAKQQLQMIVDGDDTLTITADPLLGTGDCIIESANGAVDARLATQLESLKKAIQEVIS